MKKYIGSLQTLLVMVLAAILLYQSQCTKKDIEDPEVIITVETKWDTATITQTEYVPQWRTRTEVDIDTFTVPVDTLSILKDYYAKYFYQDTLKLDSLGYLVLNDTISKNKVLSRGFDSKISIPTTTITKEIYLNKREFYWGLGVSGRPDQLNYVGGEFLYRTKKKKVYGLGVGFNQDFEPVFGGRMYFKIGK
jgi:hypothetical protein